MTRVGVDEYPVGPLMGTRPVVFSTLNPDGDAVRMLSGVVVVKRNPLPRAMTSEELLHAVRDADAVILGGEHFDRSVIEASRRLRIIARFGLGYQNIDYRSAAERGIYVTYAPSPTIIRAVAEHALGFMLCFARRFFESDRYVRGGAWSAAQGLMPRVLNLKGRTLGIVGLGKIGGDLARIARSMNMSVVYHDKYRKVKVEAEHGIRYSELDELLREADYVSINCPLTEETRGLIGRRELGLMKRSAYLVNTARGAIVDREALYEALATRSIAGAALDVFWEEPVPAGDPILGLDNVVFSPHNSATDPEAWREVSLMTAEDILRVLRGEKPTFIIPELS